MSIRQQSKCLCSFRLSRETTAKPLYLRDWLQFVWSLTDRGTAFQMLSFEVIRFPGALLTIAMRVPR